MNHAKNLAKGWIMADLVSSNKMIQMMDRSMTLASRRMSLIASNLANIDTPKYRTQDFSFQDAFKSEMEALDRQFSPEGSGSGSAFAPRTGCNPHAVITISGR